MFKGIKNPVLRETLDWAFHIAIAVIIGLLIVNFVIQRTVVNKQSMEPTLHENDNLWVEKLSTYFGKYHYGDIITVYYPEKLPAGEKLIIKRVIGLPGDTIDLRDGRVYLKKKGEKDFKLLKEDYLSSDVMTYPMPNEEDKSIKYVVPKDCVYVMGDNRGNSLDSRTFGAVEMNRVRGRAVFRFLPFNRMGFLKR